MIIKNVKLSNFRNIEKIEFSPCDEINVIFGLNAQGKTNILEALWLFSGAKSFRTSKDAELIKMGEEKARLEIEFFDEEREQNCVIEIDESRRAVLNGVEYKRASEIAGKLCAIVFSPSDLDLIKGGPNNRRRFLDTAICQLYPVYLGLLREYNRAILSRNKILKDMRYTNEVLDFIIDYEEKIAELGEKIVNYRKEFVSKLNEHLPEIFSSLSSKRDEIEVSYISSAGETKEDFIKSLKEARENDIKTLSTSVGPHRDELEVKINGISARSFGSQGQKRSASIAIKLSEAAVMTSVTNKQPIALLDDVFSELDKERQKYILNHIKNWQVFITCCDASNIEGLEKGKVFEVEAGRIREV